jgi:hypothetical protein
VPFSVSTADIESRWRPLSVAEADIGLQRLVDVERQLRIRRPTLLALYTAIVADVPPITVKADLLETIRAVLAGVVIRYLRNPDVTSRQDIGSDGSIGIGFDTRTEGGTYLSDEDLSEIDAAVAVAVGSTYSRVRSRTLVSTFPYRTSSSDTPYSVGGLLPFTIGNY